MDDAPNFCGQIVRVTDWIEQLRNSYVKTEVFSKWRNTLVVFIPKNWFATDSYSCKQEQPFFWSFNLPDHKGPIVINNHLGNHKYEHDKDDTSINRDCIRTYNFAQTHNHHSHGMFWHKEWLSMCTRMYCIKVSVDQENLSTRKMILTQLRSGKWPFR